MERIESIYYDTGGKCYLSFSGGKDSTVVLALIKMCQDIYTIPPNAIPAVFCNTGIELGATVEFVKWVKDNYYDNVQVIRPDPKHPFDWIIKNYGKPMKSKMKSEYLHRWQARHDEKALELLVGNGKYAKIKIANKDLHMLNPNFDIIATEKCCKYLKKKPFEKYGKENDIKGYITGIRTGEGGARELNTEKRLKNGGSICTTSRNGLAVKMPIIDWTDNDVDNFLNEHDICLSKAYTEQGYERTGCFLCPFSLQLQDNLVKLHTYEPLRYKAAMHWLKDVYIAQNVQLPFDTEYEKERVEKWNNEYIDMRYEMIKKYRPGKEDRYGQKSLF
jgi:3'-phosphoadenosine 5'-phosphosulfate sulfotransferase (PAPS reductase)/FAD synthetase